MWFPMLGLGIAFVVFALLFKSLLWILVIAFVIWAISRAASGGGATSPGPRSTGLDILEQRYARGEIAREEYLQKKQDILSRGAS